MDEIPDGAGAATAGGLSHALEEALRLRSRSLRLPRRSVLFTYGAAPEGLYCLESGLLRLSVTAANGKEAVLSVLQAGRWFGEASLLSEEAHMHDARAVTDCAVIVVPAVAVRGLLSDRADFLLELTRMVCRRYRQSLQRIDATILMPLPVRLARRLIEVVAAQNNEAAALARPTVYLSQEELSQMLGVSRQSVNKTLKDWESRGIVDVHYGQITVLDRDALDTMT